MLLDDNTLRQVLKEQELKIVKLVVNVCSNSIISKVGVNLGTSLISVAVFIT